MALWSRMAYNGPAMLKGRVKSPIREIVETIVLIVLIYILVRALIPTIIVNHGGGLSMEPSLHNGQRLIVNKVVYNFHPPQRGDIIVFRRPDSPEFTVVKRVIALPGEKVEIKRDGYVYVNGNDEALPEPYVGKRDRKTYSLDRVPPGHYFVLGDNRAASLDSRYFGPVPREGIIGKAWISIWPISEWGWAPNHSFASATD